MGSSWTTWADDQPQLGQSAVSLLESALGALTPSNARRIEEAEVPPSPLDAATTTRLVAELGSDCVRVDDRSRAEHSGGQSYADLVRRRRGEASAAPDAVLVPADSSGVAHMLDVCARERIAVIPWGGGTSVV